METRDACGSVGVVAKYLRWWTEPKVMVSAGICSGGSADLLRENQPREDVAVAVAVAVEMQETWWRLSRSGGDRVGFRKLWRRGRLWTAEEGSCGFVRIYLRAVRF